MTTPPWCREKVVVYYYLKRLAMQGRERKIDSLLVQRPQPHTTNLQRKEEKGKIVEDKKGESN